MKARSPRHPEDTDSRHTCVDGRNIWRQKSAVNEFNPDGISLAAIDLEIRAAAVIHHTPLHLRDDVAKRTREGDENNGELVSCYGFSFRVYTLKEADRWAVQDGDAELANIAREHPVSLLDSAPIQSAIARWLYASWHGADPGLKKLAAELLARAQGARRGRRRQHEFVPMQLRQAYDDLVAYGSLLQKCYKENGSDGLHRWFPDCERLHEVGMLVLDAKYVRQYGFPSPASIAVQYIEYCAGMSRSLIHQLVDGVTKA